MNAAQASIVMGQLHSALEEHRHGIEWDRWHVPPDSNIPGFKNVGQGCFAAVFVPEEYPDFVIKVGFKKEDSGAAYAAWCRWYAGTPHVPDIILIRRFELVYMVAMPLYEHCGLEYDDPVCLALAAYINNPGTSTALPDLVEDEVEELPSTVLTTLALIHEFFHGVASFDLHNDNWMRDSLGRVVFTDPMSYRKDRAEGDGTCGML